MSLQNRVDPWGKLNSVDARGAWMGNRGILHNQNKEIIAPWRHKAWIICKLDFKGRQREIFSNNSYSELFFMDEATALSAGHRPCAECNREKYKEFKSAWCAANAKEPSIPVSQIDKKLHTERTIRGGGKVTVGMPFAEIPDGAFIDLENKALLRWRGVLWHWGWNGYERYDSKPAASDLVNVLTPQSIVKALLHGFRPQVHESGIR
ncbi:hypothetical protein HNR62_003181 [Oceanisphaera litoralis]|uniref:hypothetical protein n=1 Tax=Oceanisphaera litoralis TaxID=225144 RepID=UPI00195DE964|nr:hypothetical protein [Oceanisphaera litoralis]MBM7457269.1 hypothetical protein [Oceanisphaera litoralis]